MIPKAPTVAISPTILTAMSPAFVEPFDSTVRLGFVFLIWLKMTTPMIVVKIVIIALSGVWIMALTVLERSESGMLLRIIPDTKTYPINTLK